MAAAHSALPFKLTRGTATNSSNTQKAHTLVQTKLATRTCERVKTILLNCAILIYPAIRLRIQKSCAAVRPFIVGVKTKCGVLNC